ncbi:low affinity immunoglobulin gamma Fc region receptor III-like [Gouania willdenowi]|uniref:low affinity immunoglobulin gamma Fc region receptor III-like n=1 Tax=Gouania willdenowi TaxID=441366 RepID=UPI00105627D9|nr:low affinity immunoglobulin gamma Fc region receptor III-like [Gouania willdenowi]
MEATSVSLLLLYYVTVLLGIRYSPCLAVTLIVHPNRVAFYKYEDLSLSCEPRATRWTVKRTTGYKTAEQLSKLRINDVFPSDSGAYWCESAEGESSPRINISVRVAGALLESPAQPVSEGDDVELRCHYRKTDDDTATSQFSASFFRNGKFIGRGKESEGRKTLQKVSTTDQGFYKCKHPTGAESAENWLSVRGRPPSPTASPTLSPTGERMTVVGLVCTILLFIFYSGILLLCIYKYRRITSARAKA